MKAVILAAGYGNRMRPLTDKRHKTLINIGGKTIIGRIIEALSLYSIVDVVVVTGYRSNELTQYLIEKYPQTQFTFIHNDRYRETNNIFSMALAFDQMAIDSDIILIESDLVIEPKVIKKIVSTEFPNAALVDKFRTGMDGTVVTVEDSIITNVIPPHLQPENFDFSNKYKTLNIYKFSMEFIISSFKKLLSFYAHAIDGNCYYELILGILIYMQQETIYAETITDELWAEVDDPNDINDVSFLFTNNRRSILQDSFGGYWNYDILDFCFIRNMYFPSGSIISEMKTSLPALIQNYGSTQKIIDQKMAWFLLCNKENIRTINGASQIYPFFQHQFRHQKCLIPMPTFGEYQRIFVDTENYMDDVGIDIHDLEQKSKTCDVIVFVNPNNPSGTEISTEYIYSFAYKNPSKTIIVDESFIEFSQYQSIILILEKHPLGNLIVVKSLSKSLGIPGIRLGYIYSCNQSILQTLDSEYLPIWNMNSLAEFMLEILLKHRRFLEYSFVKTKNDREKFILHLNEVSIVDTVFPSGGNFVTLSLKKNSPSCSEIVDILLKKHTIFVKDLHGKFTHHKRCLRLAVRLPEENNMLVSCLNNITNT